mmetsp:Transcript_11550/g.21336  ORF Transcript_11550/g.21336 Transcript_11550/m.21336 type:complete len:124 (+) Transcript_11550:221-592(+)
MLAKKQYKALNSNIPKQVKGSNNKDDKKLPQNDTQLTTRSLFVLPHPGTKQGHRIKQTRVNTNDGIPSTIICNADNALAPQMVHLKGASFSSSCILAQPLKFHQRKCSGKAPSSTISLHSQQK